MRPHNEKADWGVLRFSHRTFTPQLARMEGKKQAAVIPEKYIYIDDCCFKEDRKIKEVRLPSGCRIIGSEAFAGCQFRRGAVLPEKLEEIREKAFAGNHFLKEVQFPASLEFLGESCYKECTVLRTAAFAAGSRCREIPEGCFERCGKLEKVVLPERTGRIGKRAFYRCRELKEICFPDTLEEIGEEAFYFCSMETLELPEGLQKLGDRAFFGCKKIREVSVPESVRFLGKEVFHGCNRLEYLEIRHDPEEIGSGIVNGGCTIRCRKGSRADAYCEEEGLKREYIPD